MSETPVSPSGEEGHVPEGMTAEKLRTIAGWLDTYDRLAQRHVELLEALVSKGLIPPIEGGEPEAALNAIKGKDVQDDLRRWADELDANGGSLEGPEEAGRDRSIEGDT